MLVMPPVEPWPATRLFAALRKVMNRPSPLITGLEEPSLPVVVAEVIAWLTSIVVPVAWSYKKTSLSALVSTCPATRFVPLLLNAANRPSMLVEGEVLSPLGVTEGVGVLAKVRTVVLGSAR